MRLLSLIRNKKWFSKAVDGLQDWEVAQVGKGNKSCHKDGSSGPCGCQELLQGNCGYFRTTLFGWVETRKIPAGWAYEDTSGICVGWVGNKKLPIGWTRQRSGAGHEMI